MKQADFSIPVIEQKFNQFNKEFFDNKLSRPDLVITISEKQLGYCKTPSSKDIYKGKTLPTIGISSYFEVSEEEMENTIIHEMVHLYQHQILKERMNHKDSFKRVAKEIAKKSNNKYIITRTNSRAEHKLSVEGKMKADRKTLNGSNPVIMICKQTTPSNEEFAWFVRLSRPRYEQVFKHNILAITNPTMEVIGFIYDKPQTWLYRTSSCRSKFRGKRMDWEQFRKEHENDVIAISTKGYIDNPNVIFNS